MSHKLVGLRIAETWQALVDYMTMLSKADEPLERDTVLPNPPDNVMNTDLSVSGRGRGRDA